MDKMIRLSRFATVSIHTERGYSGIGIFICGVLFSFSAAKSSPETADDTTTPQQSRYPVGTGELITCPECDGTGKLETVMWLPDDG